MAAHKGQIPHHIKRKEFTHQTSFKTSTKLNTKRNVGWNTYEDFKVSSFIAYPDKLKNNFETFLKKHRD